MPSRIKLGKQRRIIADLLLQVLQLATCGYMDDPSYGAQAGDVLLMFAILVGQIEGHPLSASKLSEYVGMPRSTVIRRLKELHAGGMTELDGNGRSVLVISRLNRARMVGAVQEAIGRIHRASAELSKLDSGTVAEGERR